MTRNLKYKFAFIAAVMLICVYGIIGLPKSMDQLVANWKKNIHLGLDLKGGTYLVLQVQVQDAFKAEADGVIQRLQEAMPGITAVRNDPPTIADADKIQIDVHGVPPEKAVDFRQLATTQFGNDWILTPAANDYKLTIRPTAAFKLKQDTLTQSKNTIEKKINGLGLAESSVQERGGGNNPEELMVQLPGVDDPAHVKQILQTAAVLELDEVKGGPYANREEAMVQNGGILPLNSKLVRGISRGGGAESWYLLGRTPVVTGRDLRDARPSQGEVGRWETTFVLTQDAAKRFERFTEAHIRDRLAIVLDNVVLSAPTIENKISDNGRITGLSGHEEASDLALNLRAGSLPASVLPLQETSVGPSLGNDSVRDGIRAGLGGLIAVVAVMLFYYRRSGVNATLALVLNAIILIAALSYFDATLTLPGIAGVILTIGMAVDSNVLIFERIREELRAGKAVIAAVETGFSRAFLTIVDTHVTTIVSCAFLFLFGSGPVKGFAVTLVIGLFANVFTAVFVSKAIFELELSGQRQAVRLSI